MPLKNPTPTNFIDNRVVRSNNCLLWVGSKTKRGYGKIDTYYWAKVYKVNYAHQLAYKLAYGEYDKSLQLNHKCNNPSCVNHEHLYLGTHQQNMDDMVRLGSNKGSKHRAAKLTEDDIKDIKILLSTTISQANIARLYNVSPMTVSNIKHNKNWTHVQCG